ncbi:MAG: efflux RND transporter permease subunit, partial [Oscillospiraceae bacterium]
IDYENQEDAQDVLKDLKSKQLKLILRTVFTTILAMSTMAMGVGMGSAMSQGMAIVTIGGLSYATLLTLFLVPALYDILHRREIKNIDVDFEE